MVMKFVSHGALMINRGTRILFVFHLYSCSKHNLSTTLLANVVNLAHLLGTLSNDNDDGSENVAKKMNLRSFNLNRVYLDTTLYVKCRRLFLELNC